MTTKPIKSSYSILLMRDDCTVSTFRMRTFWFKLIIIMVLLMIIACALTVYGTMHYKDRYTSVAKERRELQTELDLLRVQLQNRTNLAILPSGQADRHRGNGSNISQPYSVSSVTTPGHETTETPDRSASGNQGNTIAANSNTQPGTTNLAQAGQRATQSGTTNLAQAGQNATQPGTTTLTQTGQNATQSGTTNLAQAGQGSTDTPDSSTPGQTSTAALNASASGQSQTGQRGAINSDSQGATARNEAINSGSQGATAQSGATNSGTAATSAQPGSANSPSADSGNRSATTAAQSGTQPASGSPAIPAAADLRNLIASNGPVTVAGAGTDLREPAAMENHPVRIANAAVFFETGNKMRVNFDISNQPQKETLAGNCTVSVITRQGAEVMLTPVSRGSLTFRIERYKKMQSVLIIPENINKNDVVQIKFDVTVNDLPNYWRIFPYPIPREV